MKESLSHTNSTVTLLSSQNSIPIKKQVHFSTHTTDIITTLRKRRQFQFSYSPVQRSTHPKPILKYPDNMADYLRRAGNSFSYALHSMGVWCAGVTSKNPNIRSDMYKQLVAQIRGVS